MFLTDPALRWIAAATDDVLPDHLWRHDTARDDTCGELATLLHKITLRFNDSSSALDKAVNGLAERSNAAQQLLCAGVHIRYAGQLQAIADIYAASEQHTVLGELLVEAYQGWRSHRTIGDGDERYLLLQPGDPSYGVAMLRRQPANTWLMFVDAEAAAAFQVPYPARILGEIRRIDAGWLPTASTSPDHHPKGTADRLPQCEDLATACRALLRWWRLRHSPEWNNRRPVHLSPAERAELTA
ncbi:hypothetical protein [Asanoa iriomotensis]|uniref:Uncharacterized protein n=1 Tax=Asanoa iriomotensis TaxID=234613 RepID=A0ABQ4C1G4_9ACTN|nr:hypothetical protein [Asanoa iriomotensis]GIF56626.1 hypothetical protein Air01nite_27210 [Asanoa iriomotensis]